MQFPDFPVSIVRRRVKYARIEIRPSGEVRVVIPMRYSQSALGQLLAEKSAWVEKHLRRIASIQHETAKLGEGEILLLGEVVRRPPQISTASALELWYKKQAREYIGERLMEYIREHGFIFGRITLRSARTRWGSCSRKKNISLNWHLVKAPPHVFDYVILHELVHTIYFDHSKRFWKKLEEVCPHHKESREWLKKYGSSLHH